MEKIGAVAQILTVQKWNQLYVDNLVKITNKTFQSYSYQCS